MSIAGWLKVDEIIFGAIFYKLCFVIDILKE